MCKGLPFNLHCLLCYFVVSAVVCWSVSLTIPLVAAPYQRTSSATLRCPRLSQKRWSMNGNPLHIHSLYFCQCDMHCLPYYCVVSVVIWLPVSLTILVLRVDVQAAPHSVLSLSQTNMTRNVTQHYACSLHLL